MCYGESGLSRKSGVDKSSTPLLFLTLKNVRESTDNQSRQNDEKVYSVGNIPRPASASRALLRLSPCHRIYLRPTKSETSGTPGFLGLTGGEYKARERIHGSIADLPLLAIPTS